MPRKKKKSLQEKTAEGFFPIGTDDLKKTVEKQERPEIYEAKVSVEKHSKKIVTHGKIVMINCYQLRYKEIIFLRIGYQSMCGYNRP